MTTDPTQFADLDFCYVTTIGRVSGRPHTIEIWFSLNQHTIYMLSDGGMKADWVKNLLRTPNVRVRIGDVDFAGVGRIVQDQDEDALARRLVVEKYQPRYSDDLSDWRQTAFPVAIDLHVS